MATKFYKYSINGTFEFDIEDEDDGYESFEDYALDTFRWGDRTDEFAIKEAVLDWIANLETVTVATVEEISNVEAIVAVDQQIVAERKASNERIKALEEQRKEVLKEVLENA